VGVQSSTGNTPDAESLIHGLAVGLGLSPKVWLTLESQSEVAQGTRGLWVQALGHWRFVGARPSALETALSLGLRREVRGAGVVLARLGAVQRRGRLDIGGHVAIEHPMSAGRDAVDLGVGTAASYAWGGGVRTGIELAAEDLEGLWEQDAEGGAQAFLGPTLSVSPPGRSWTLFVGGGPALLSRSGPDQSGAPREFSTSAGYVFRIALRLGGGF